ncbi:Cyclin-dependent protein kinase inhibitor SMR [Heracleum sosnowskyi]|uniref:Cyclin-dependent protein kinase inhibitor SMR n=1 Tax=Heracleum sosnowskyi TaxID=360622 RepID=A0AAD8MV76_9APIA|nr:Cyclin-dependent protein kinase inhibitor SMR [Heracleum sosnowskyi]
MAPSGRRVIRRRTITTRSSTKSAKQATKIDQKKKISCDGFGEKNVVSKENVTISSEVLNNNGCSTPKGKKFRIPRINKCPPAPMKRRPSSSTNINVSSSCTSLKRSPISFFSPPDLELFFFFASSDHNTNTV